ncbi:methyl-accepting chemotaxis protein [Enterovibrio paralichthyis]|uniref:methyl-accepting chemotaxis protein n=1 Tax=Enterovibrio paralichthyis TaxID=2853805 RepID=UPI001C486486|nr:methyl-accepting chemotaxis protein [Enterovibrio paralichthyis]MBV7299338.1 methyl-accepting chemotaxis protein [Enterovibrio paralichthyis]
MRLPIAAKILIVLFFIFSVVLAVSLVYQNNQQKTLVTDIVGEQTLDKASNYFDSLNMMMLTGTIHQKEALRQKVLEQNGIEDARVIRADGITSIFGPGNPEQAIADSIDQRAVGGETIIENVTRDYGPGIVVALPMKASSSYRGTNCLQCHVVPEDTVLGVVRLEYNLSALYETINNKMLVTAAIMTAITLAGFALTFGFIRNALVSPLKRISLFMRTCSNDKNLSERITLSQQDEIGQLADSCNALLDGFSGSLHQVRDTAKTLVDEAKILTNVSSETNKLVENQRRETQEMSSSIDDVQHHQHIVEEKTTEAAELSKSLANSAQQGRNDANVAAEEIQQLVQEIEQVRHQILAVNQQSLEVNSILEVIRAIAEQTNLLALNAAIEAARAGEQGRGFAVVADEVRNLASRTHDATGDIQSIIEQLTADASKSANAIDATCESTTKRAETVMQLSRSLAQMAEEILTVNSNAEEISKDSVEQAKMADALRDQVMRIQSHADDTATNANQTQEISTELQQLSDQLEHMIGRFKLA